MTTWDDAEEPDAAEAHKLYILLRGTMSHIGHKKTLKVLKEITTALETYSKRKGKGTKQGRKLPR